MQYSVTCRVRPPYWPENYGLSRQVGFGDRFNYIEKYLIFCQGYVVFQDGWYFTAVVSQERFHRTVIAVQVAWHNTT